MPHHFGNDAHDGYSAKSYQYEPKWEKLVDFNPDHQRSSAPIWTTEAVDNGNEVLMVIVVRGLGVLTLHSLDEEFIGVGEFTETEIGHAAEL